MTVETTVRTVDHLGNGSTTVFVIPFPFVDPAHVRVTLIDGTTLSVTLWTLGVNYTLAGGNPTGTLTATIAPATGTTLHGERIVPYLQPMNLEPNDGFDAVAMEGALDRLTMEIQQVADTGGGGGSSGSIGVANVGAGEPVSVGLVGATYNLRSFKASGTGLSVASDADSITYTVAGLLAAALNLTDVANRQTSLNNLTAASAGTVGHVLQLDATKQAIWAPAPTGGGGEANTSSSAGGTVALALAKSGVNLPFRGLTAGANITLTPSGTDVTIAATTSGEVNTLGSGAVTGQTLVATPDKVGVQMKTKGIAPGTAIVLSPTLTDLGIGIDQTAALAWTGIHKHNVGADVDLSGAAYGLGAPGFDAARSKYSRTVTGARTDGKIQGAFVASTRINTPSTGGINYGEWTGLFTMEDRTDDGVHSSALYTKSLKYGTSAIFGAVFQVQNMGGSVHGNMYGLEIDLQSDGTATADASVPGGTLTRVGQAIFYGAATSVFTAGATTKQNAALLIQPFFDGRNQLVYGLWVNAGDIDEVLASSARGGSMIACYGRHSDAIINLDGATNSPIAIDMGGGSRMRFRSGTGSGGGALQTWWPVITTYTPVWGGVLEIVIDSTVRYLPVAINKPV